MIDFSELRIGNHILKDLPEETEGMSIEDVTKINCWETKLGDLGNNDFYTVVALKKNLNKDNKIGWEGVIYCLGNKYGYYDFRNENYKPIQITPEILDEFGFIKTFDYWQLNDFMLELRPVADCLDNYYVAIIYDGKAKYLPKTIKYVHQLQNYYKTFVEKELVRILK